MATIHRIRDEHEAFAAMDDTALQSAEVSRRVRWAMRQPFAPGVITRHRRRQRVNLWPALGLLLIVLSCFGVLWGLGVTLGYVFEWLPAAVADLYNLAR